MSRLDDTFDQYRKDCFLAKDTGLEKSVNMLALSSLKHKGDIKALILGICFETFDGEPDGPLMLRSYDEIKEEIEAL